MKLTQPDEIEFLRAALNARDLESLKQYLVSCVNAVREAQIAEGKVDVSPPAPVYVAPADRNGHAPVQSHARWDEGTLLA